MRRDDRRFRPADRKEPAPVRVWLLTLLIAGVMAAAAFAVLLR